MIKANELRIGNVIMDRGGKMWQIDCWESPTKVAAKPPLIDAGFVFGKMYGHPLTEEIDYLQPVPVSRDILEKLGFMGVKSNYEVAETIDYTNGILCFDMANQSTIINGKSVLSFIPDFVHQLQNLYFALTSEELDTTKLLNQ